MQGIVLLSRILVALAMMVATLAPCAARADEIEVTEARLAAAEDGIALAADFAFDLSPRLVEVATNGVPLYFVVEFELTRPRWYWFDERAASKRLQIRLSYHALSRQYRLSTGALQQNYASLEDAMRVLRRVRNWQVVDRASTLSDATYEAAVRMRLDVALLPKPFQLSAITSRDLNLESAWKRFPYRPGGAAPVESREPKEADSR